MADGLRPTTLDDVIGQTEVVNEIRIALAGAKARGEVPGHILLGGPAGTGKTTLALCIANAVGGQLLSLIGPQVRTPSSDLYPILFGRAAGDVIFIDEIHRMWRPAQECLFTVMEDSKLILDNGRTLDMRPLLFIGATTDPDRLLTPMLDRFALILKLRLYRPDELALIAKRAAIKLGCVLSDEGAALIVDAAVGVPRVAIRLVRASRDHAYAVQLLADSRREPVTIGPAAVQRVLSSPAYIWRSEGRDAG